MGIGKRQGQPVARRGLPAGSNRPTPPSSAHKKKPRPAPPQKKIEPRQIRLSAEPKVRWGVEPRGYSPIKKKIEMVSGMSLGASSSKTTPPKKMPSKISEPKWKFSD